MSKIKLLLEVALECYAKRYQAGAYNHAECLEERTEVMQWYADYLDNLNGILS